MSRASSALKIWGLNLSQPDAQANTHLLLKGPAPHFVCQTEETRISRGEDEVTWRLYICIHNVCQ